MISRETGGKARYNVQEVSGDSEISSNERSRTMEVIQTLDKGELLDAIFGKIKALMVDGISSERPYKVPNAKTTMSMIFWRSGIWSLLMRGMGIAIIMMSVAMFNSALENQKAVLSIQEPSPSPQKNLTGTHMNMEPKTVHSPYTTRRGIRTLQIF